MHAHQWPYERAKTDPLALQLIELAVSAGWAPRECIEFAREAHKLVTSTASVVGTHQPVAPAKNIAVDLGQPGKSTPDSALRLHRPEWGPDPETRLKTLHAAAALKLRSKEAANILGVTTSTVTSAAHKLKIRFHRRRGRKPQRAAGDINGAAKPKKRTAMHVSVNGKAVAHPAAIGPADPIGLRSTEKQRQGNARRE